MPNLESLSFFVPELVLCGTIVLLLFVSALKSALYSTPKCSCSIAPYVTLAALVSSLLLGLGQWGLNQPSLFMDTLSLDSHVEFFRLIFVATAIIVVIFSLRSRELYVDGESGAGFCSLVPKENCEYFALILGVVVGMSLLAAARNLLMIYLAIEFVSLSSYILVGYAQGSPRSSEAALKYVLFGAVASGVFLFGASLFYGLSGSLDIFGLLQVQGRPISVFVVTGLFLLGGFLFKIAAIPMHVWCPDAYEGAPTPITAFLSVAPKAAGFAVLMRVFAAFGVEMNWTVVLAVVSAVTMTLGNLAAIPQTNVKRLLAYSSIAHAGYLLMGVVCLSIKGNEAVYFYFIAYMLMNLGAFLVVQIVSNRTGSDNLGAFTGIGRAGSYGAFVAISMTIFLLSLTGVPPFVGFIGKFYLFSAVIEAKLWWLAIVGIINSVISLYYYMRIVVVMFFRAPSEDCILSMDSKLLTALLAMLAALVVILGLFWNAIAVLVRF